ncbi:predicted protein [Nematostella vectensis]|uniref:Uncharacterized protein n=1 Tax=Nematostella vectensis TaxID=45351 RepID=A7S810_NEMVE|nr:predicted protein [Nematostella vectensis]|eukprot:XP_001632233.1 predicted protein [Nematostella vectensis]
MQDISISAPTISQLDQTKQQFGRLFSRLEALADICDIHLLETWKELQTPLGTIKIAPNGNVLMDSKVWDQIKTTIKEFDELDEALADICDIHLLETWKELQTPLGTIKIAPNGNVLMDSKVWDQIKTTIKEFDELDEGLKKLVVPAPGDWPTWFYQKKLIAQEVNADASFLSVIPEQGLFHVFLNLQEDVVTIYDFLFKKVYKETFGSDLPNKPKPFRVSLVITAVFLAWGKLRDKVLLKFKLCKYIEYASILFLLDEVVPISFFHYPVTFSIYDTVTNGCGSPFFSVVEAKPHLDSVIGTVSLEDTLDLSITSGNPQVSQSLLAFYLQRLDREQNLAAIVIANGMTISLVGHDSKIYVLDSHLHYAHGHNFGAMIGMSPKADLEEFLRNIKKLISPTFDVCSLTFVSFSRQQ